MTDYSQFFSTSRKVWNDRYYREAYYRWNWQVMAAVFAFIAVICAAGFWHVVQQAHVQVIVAQIDSQGHFLGAYEATPETVTVSKAQAIGKDIERLIEEVRSVGADYMQKRAEYTRADARVLGEAEKIVDQYFKDYPPHELMKTMTVYVEVQSVLKEEGKTWRVRWTEERRDKTSQVSMGKTWWEAVVTVEVQPPPKESALLNPFGIYYTSIHWGQTKDVQS